MIQNPTLPDIIRQHLSLNKPNTHGWFNVICKVCSDHGRKGKRAAFRFDGDIATYNCFNCGHSAGYDPAKHISMNGDPFMPHPMVTVLDAFGIPKADWQQVMFTAVVNQSGASFGTTKTIDSKLSEPKEIQLPPYFYPLTDDPTDEWAQCAIEYLREERGIDWRCHQFYLVRKTKSPDNKRWYGRLIIPTFKQGKLIFWQGRDLTGTMVKKYMSPDVPRDNILSGYDQLESYSEEPLYIVEGWFDAYHVNGVATFGNKLTNEQIKWINKSSRPKVVIPDRFGDGQLLALQGVKLGWSVALPDVNEKCKDVSDIVKYHGRLYMFKTIRENTFNSEAAELLIPHYCNYDTPTSSNSYKKTSPKARG